MTVSMAPAEFGDRLRNLLTEVYGPIPAEAAETESEIALAETRIGLPLPPMLRVCYQISGRHRALTHGYVCLLSCSQLLSNAKRFDKTETEIPGLIFLVEQQKTEWFVLIPPAEQPMSDPGTYIGRADSLYFHWQRDHLSSCLFEAVCQNSVGVLPNGQAKVSRLDLDKVSSLLHPLTEEKMIFTFQKGNVIAFAERLKSSADYNLSVASNSHDKLVEFETQMGISFAYKDAERLSPPNKFPFT